MNATAILEKPTLEQLLTQDLQHRLETAGLTTEAATHVVDLLPPAGRHELCTELRDNPEALPELAITFLGSVAARLRITHADADVVRAHFLTAVA